MERYFDDNEGKLFIEAHVINPNSKPTLVNKPKVFYENPILNNIKYIIVCVSF